MKRKFLFAFTAVALLSLAACGKTEQPKGNTNENPYKDLPAETNEELTKELEIVSSMVDPSKEEPEYAVYGNVRLPDEVDGATISWWSSNPNVINPNQNGDVAPGEVNRQQDDIEVTLTAQIEKDGVKTKFDQTVTVRAAAPELTDGDYEAYLFGHFVGEGDQWGTTVDGKRVTNGEQIFFSLAEVGEGLRFKDMNGSRGTNYSSLKPVLTSEVGERGVRDPFIYRSPEGDTFYLIATDLSVYTRGGWGNNAGQATKTGSRSIVLWESHDLVNWTEERLIQVAREDAGMAWAPEMIYCEETGEYLIFFSSTILSDYSNEDRSLNTNAKIIHRDSVFFTTTRDFVHFGETREFIPKTHYQDDVTSRNESEGSAVDDDNDYRKVIDGSVIKIDDYYYSASKDGGNDEEGGGIRIQRTQDLYDADWDFVMNLADTGFVSPWNYNANGRSKNALTNQCLEGPEWFFLNEADRQPGNDMEIGLMADFYKDTSKGYMPFSTSDIEDTDNSNNSWRQLASGTDYDWDNKGNTKRHGTILRITAAEADRLKDAFPIVE